MCGIEFTQQTPPASRRRVRRRTASWWAARGPTGVRAHDDARRELLGSGSSADREARGELDEHADAVAARARADRVSAIVVEERGPEHVDVCPRPVAGEALEEGRGEDRISERLPGAVAEVRDA